MNDPENWEVWNVKGSSIQEGTEDEVKRFVEEQYPRLDLSVVSPDGNEYVLEGGRWTLV